MDIYYMLADMFAGEKPLSYLTALAVILAAAFSAFVTSSRSREYISAPDLEGYNHVKAAAKFLKVISVLLYQWCLFAVVYLLIRNRGVGVEALYIAVCVLAAAAVIYSFAAIKKYNKAKNIFNSLYFKANKGNLNALAGNPLGLDSRQQDVLNSILSAEPKSNGSFRSDPLGAVLTGAAEIKKAAPAEAAKENLEEAAGGETRECPFCKKQVEKKYPICIYCGMVIPDRNKDYRNESKAPDGFEGTNKMQR